MNIVVIGNGKVGHVLVEQLSKEGHDITIIDNDIETLEDIVNMQDVIGVLGNGANYEIQKEAGVGTADLLLAVTSADEINMLCCLIGKKLGVKSAIARIRNPEYSNQMFYLKEELGVNMSINPEYAASREIARLLSFPSALKIESFARDRVEIVEVRIEEGNPLVGVKLSDIARKLNIKILICSIHRGNEIYIPKGDMVLQVEDKVSIISTRVEITALLKKLGIYKNKVKNVMIIGGNRMAYYLAKQLEDVGINVKIIEINRERSIQLAELLPKATVVHGDGTNQEILNEEGIERVDAFVGLTDRDEENIIVSIYAEKKGVKKVIAKVNRLSYMDILNNMKIDSVISPKFITASQIIQYVRAMGNTVGTNVETLHRIVDNTIEALEFIIPKKNINKECENFLNIPLKELSIKSETLVASIIRNGKVIIPNGNDVIMNGDNVIVVSKEDMHYDDFRDIFVK